MFKEKFLMKEKIKRYLLYDIREEKFKINRDYFSFLEKEDIIKIWKKEKKLFLKVIIKKELEKKLKKISYILEKYHYSFLHCTGTLRKLSKLILRNNIY